MLASVSTRWKIVAGSGQSLTLTTLATNYHFPNKVGFGGAATQCIAISLAPLAALSATGYAMVTVTPANGGTGTAATASTDYMIKASDPPQLILCNTGDYVNVMPAASGLVAFLVELTH